MDVIFLETWQRFLKTYIPHLSSSNSIYYVDMHVNHNPQYIFSEHSFHISQDHCAQLIR